MFNLDNCIFLYCHHSTPITKELRRQPVKTLGFGEALVAVKAVGVCATATWWQFCHLLIHLPVYTYQYHDHLMIFPDVRCSISNSEESVIFFPCRILGREDVELFDGTMGYYHSGLSTVPLVPGHEWAGALAERKKILESFEHVYL